MDDKASEARWEAAVALIAWWVILGIIFTVGPTWPAVLLSLVCVLPLLWPIRHVEAAVIAWMPVAAGLGTLFLMGLAEANAFLGDSSQRAHAGGGITALAITISLPVVLLLVGVVLLTVPREWSRSVGVVALVNTACLALAANELVARNLALPVQVRVLDSSGAPLPDVEVDYVLSDYGLWNFRARPIFRKSGLKTGADGVVEMKFRRGRHQLLATFSKPGFVPMKADLGYELADKPSLRRLSVSRAEEYPNGIFTTVPVSVPQTFSIYLGRVEELESRAVAEEIRATFSPGRKTIFLDIDGLRETPGEADAELRLDLLTPRDKWINRPVRTKVTGLKGTGVLLKDKTPVSFSPPLSDFDRVMGLAPPKGYSESVIHEFYYGTKSDRIYSSSRDGELHAWVSIHGSAYEDTYTVSIRIIRAEGGSRVMRLK
jgi:hypothetical protein